ncbi:MAG: HPr kinase/phosphorylase [Beijerinckiaceae bacterium]
MNPASAGSSRLNIHGVALALGETGLLVLGSSGAGKSMLAARLLSAWPHGPVRLVADDRVLLERHHDRLVARPHPRIAGLLECRGFGIVRPPSLEAVVIRAAITLGDAPPDRHPDPLRAQMTLLDLAVPHCVLAADGNAANHLFALWPYFSGLLGPF